MDDKFKNLSFKDFITVDYTMTGDEFLAYQAQKRRRGHFDTFGDDYTPEGNELKEEEIDEVMTQSQRIKKSQQMKRMSKRIQIAKKRALKKAPTQDVLMKRAQKQAKNQLIKKWTKGSKSDLSMGRRAEIEKRLKKSKTKIDRTAKRMLPDLRRQDRDRRANANSSDKK